MADTSTTVNIMLFEGGALIDALSDKPVAVTLADKIAAEDRKALADGQISFDLVLDPIEVGMALNALTTGQSALSQSLGDKVRRALAAKLEELGIGTEASTPGGGLTSAPSQEPTTDTPSDPSTEPSTEPSGDDAPTTDNSSSNDGNTYETL